MNKGITTALSTIALAQFLKIPIHKIQNGKWKWSLFFETGGMPSSHSAGVSSLATYVAVKRGITTIDFALSTVFGLIVMYDAQGIRRQTGEITLKVNQLDESIERLKGIDDYHVHDKQQQKLKEMLGHQPIEVLGGALLGITTGVLSALLSRSRKK
ncbi:divergent PAP2 family protein [Bacillus sp. HMF5848]|uniref:divergent PAP2 family protein n=1 Tax=Bacillus sp. HMF5848 TaxID=2495421 RepID=UPI000F7B869D|nr:divergent PAP2 family protein [Bacillus sp. HMF5848]RSK27326.1 divergent PAP2 family protein [Bacillus sp. HMF5848]